MAQYKRGRRSLIFENHPVITAWASIAGKKEGQGPLKDYFDIKSDDTLFGEKIALKRVFFCISIEIVE
jgi:stage V sporulation protein AD